MLIGIVGIVGALIILRLMKVLGDEFNLSTNKKLQEIIDLLKENK